MKLLHIYNLQIIIQDVEKIVTCVLEKNIPITSKTVDNTYAFIVGNSCNR